MMIVKDINILTLTIGNDQKTQMHQLKKHDTKNFTHDKNCIKKMESLNTEVERCICSKV